MGRRHYKETELNLCHLISDNLFLSGRRNDDEGANNGESCLSPLPIPDFTPLVKYGLRNGDSVAVWTNLIGTDFFLWISSVKFDLFYNYKLIEIYLYMQISVSTSTVRIIWKLAME